MKIGDVKIALLKTKHEFDIARTSSWEDVEESIAELKDMIKRVNGDMILMANSLMEANGHYTKEEIEREDLY
jgi:hypothetical protein